MGQGQAFGFRALFCTCVRVCVSSQKGVASERVSVSTALSWRTVRIRELAGASSGSSVINKGIRGTVTAMPPRTTHSPTSEQNQSIPMKHASHSAFGRSSLGPSRRYYTYSGSYYPYVRCSAAIAFGLAICHLPFAILQPPAPLCLRTRADDLS